MSEYANKLAAITAKKQKLLQEENKLIDKRKKEIASAAERVGLLTASDELIAGLFLDAANALKENKNRIKEWEAQGERFLNTKKQHTDAA
jgi:hypothetical protein